LRFGAGGSIRAVTISHAPVVMNSSLAADAATIGALGFPTTDTKLVS